MVHRFLPKKHSASEPSRPSHVLALQPGTIWTTPQYDRRTVGSAFDEKITDSSLTVADENHHSIESNFSKSGVDRQSWRAKPARNPRVQDLAGMSRKGQRDIMRYVG